MIALAAVFAAAATEPSMNDALIAALDRALAGDARVLAGFGIERSIFTSPAWDDRTVVDGAGNFTFMTTRSPTDRGGEPIGFFRTKLEPAEMQALLRALKAVAQKALTPMRAEPYETRLVLTAVADGRIFRYGTKAAPPAIEPLQPLLQPLNVALMKALATPVRSLWVEMEPLASVPRAGAVVVTMHLHNDGDEGFWISNPLALANQKEHERAELVYAPPIVFTPGVQPLPVTPRRTLLKPQGAAKDEPRFRWLAPKGDLAVTYQGYVEAADAKELVLRGELYLDEGEDTVSGQPRIRGSVFSPDIKARVGD
jgi:hypothetical protein